MEFIGVWIVAAGTVVLGIVCIINALILPAVEWLFPLCPARTLAEAKRIGKRVNLANDLYYELNKPTGFYARRWWAVITLDRILVSYYWRRERQHPRLGYSCASCRTGGYS